MKICKKVLSVEKINNYYEITTDAGIIHLMFIREDIVRIRVSFDGTFKEASYSLVTTAWPDALDDFFEGERRRVDAAESNLINMDSEGDGGDYTITTSALRVVISSNPFIIQVYDSDNNLLHSDIPSLAYRCDSNGRRIHTCRIFDGDGFYGFGEQTGHLNKFEDRVILSPGDAMGYNPAKRDSLYKHIPFYIRANSKSKINVGYFYHNTYDAEFDLGKSHSNYWERHSSYISNGGDIDLFIISGKTVADVVSGYTYLTGTPAFLPKKALGYLGSSMYYSELESDCDDALLKFIRSAKEQGFPIDGFQLSSGYTTAKTSDGNKRCVFTWNRERFKNPADFFTQMKKQGIVVSPNVKPGILLTHPDFAMYAEDDIFIKKSDDAISDSSVDNAGSSGDYAVGTWWGGDGAFVDFTNPKARNAWKKYLKKNVLDYGTASVWNDNCEYDSIVDLDSRCDFEGMGSTVAELKNVMSNIMCKITHDAITESYENTRPFIVCRAGHSGIQRYAQNWSGDNLTSWESLRLNLATILGMALCGVSNYGADVGGFYGPAPEPELLVRWVQNGIFFPRFSIHSVNTDNTVTEPWMYPSVRDYVLDAIRLRYSFSAYYYALMRAANITGHPILRPLMFGFSDEFVYEEDAEFMVGDSLLVSNVLDRGESIHEIRLPGGCDFYDFYTRKKYAGGSAYSIDVNLGSIPMFIKSGGIIPFVENRLSNLTDDITGLRYIIAPSDSSSFEMYEDDGSTYYYKDGYYLVTKVESFVKSGGVTIAFSYEGSYKSTIKDVTLDVICENRCPAFVSYNEQRLQQYIYQPEFVLSNRGWYYDIEKSCVMIKYPYDDKPHEVFVCMDEFDMLGL